MRAALYRGEWPAVYHGRAAPSGDTDPYLFQQDLFMKFRNLALVVFLALVAAFVALNLQAVMAPTALNLAVAEVQAPLGLVLLGLLVLVAAVFLGALLYQQTLHLMEVRRVTREMGEQRTLADKAEASRFTELRTLLQAEMQAAAEREKTLTEQLQNQVDQLQRSLALQIEQSGNGLAASIGEMEDRLERLLQQRAARV